MVRSGWWGRVSLTSNCIRLGEPACSSWSNRFLLWQSFCFPQYLHFDERTIQVSIRASYQVTIIMILILIVSVVDIDHIVIINLAVCQQMQLFCIFRYVYCSRSIRVHVVWGLSQVSVHFKYAHKLCFFQSCSMDCGMQLCIIITFLIFFWCLFPSLFDNSTGCSPCYKVCLDAYTYCIRYRRTVATSSTKLICCLNGHKNGFNDFNFTCSFNSSIFR